MKKTILKQLQFIALFLIMVNCISGQNEADHWYFGHSAGIDFSSGDLELDFSSSMEGNHGSTVCSDEEGELKFYSNGFQVWNSDHIVMPNGNLIDSCVGENTFQNCISVPVIQNQNDPNLSEQYYLFTVQSIFSGAKGLSYYIIDMSSDNGKGDVTSEAINVIDSTRQGVIVTKHGNEIDYWLITKRIELLNNEYRNTYQIFLINENGVNFNNNFVGGIATNASTAQTGCFSPNGNLFYWSNSVLEFDKNTGEVNGFQKLDTIFNGYTNGAFSPNNELLYVSNFGSTAFTLDQFDLNSIDIPNSKIEIDVVTDGMMLIKGGLQLAPNGKIYVSYLNKIGVINDPNEIGVSCNLVQDNIVVPGNSRWCFPTFSSHIFNSIQTNIQIKDNKSNSLSIYPNPITNQFSILIANQNFTYQISNLAGSPITKGVGFNSTTINLDNAQSGIYILRIVVNDTEIEIRKIIKS